MRLRLAYGREGHWIELPDDAPVSVIEPLFIPGLPDEAAAIREALRCPLGTAPLRTLVTPNDTVAVVFSDLTRPMPNDRVLPVLLEELDEAGVPAEQITLINGLGTHRVQTDAELRTMLGDAIVERYRIEQHDAWDEANLVEAGLTNSGRRAKINRTYMEASVRILTGFIEPHLFAGFSGGPKAVLPGITDIETIIDNHGAAHIADPQATYGVTEGNPLWEEIRRVALSTAPTFLLNVTINRKRGITGVFAGDVEVAHAMGTAFVRKTAMQPVEAPFDIMVTSNSGYPLDLNLYQCVKGMTASAQVIAPGGDIIVAAECWDGLPSHGQYANLLRSAASPRELLDKIMTPGFRCHDQWTVQCDCQVMLKANVHVYAGGLTDDDIRTAFMQPCHSIEETIAELRRANPTARIAVLPEGPQTVPYLAA